MDIKHLPKSPGVYLMRDAAANVIYIGKAKDLRKRVAHYFRESAGTSDAKLPNLVALIRSVDYIASASEREALLLERELIHSHQPFFNVLWKDAKSYPYIKITAEDFPRILFTRKKYNDGARYFGPYPKVEPLKNLVNHLRRIKFVDLRRCRWEFSLKSPLPPSKINACLYYHTGQCPAPCAGRISAAAYRRLTKRTESFFNGDFGKLLKEFRSKMQASSRLLDYETAAHYRDFIGAIEHMSERVLINEFKKDLVTRETLKTGAVTALMKALDLKTPPVHIEAFDTSSIGGSCAVAASVCFKNGEKNPEHYRRYKIRFRNVPGGSDDPAMINETVARRLARIVKDGHELPDLLLIDGGPTQLAAALRAVRGLSLKVPVIALAKISTDGTGQAANGTADKIYLSSEKRPILLDRGHQGLRLLQAMRDEVHRFAIGYHRLLRGKNFLK